MILYNYDEWVANAEEPELTYFKLGKEAFVERTLDEVAEFVEPADDDYDAVNDKWFCFYELIMKEGAGIAADLAREELKEALYTAHYDGNYKRLTGEELEGKMKANFDALKELEVKLQDAIDCYYWAKMNANICLSNMEY